MITCDEAAEQLNAYLDRELTPETMQLVEEHIQQCQRCIGRVEFDRALRRLVKHYLLCEQLSPTVKTLIRQKLKE